MGNQFVNYQIKSKSTLKVVDSIGKISSGKSYISSPIEEWITIYDEKSENWREQSTDAYIINTTKYLSADLGTVVFAFIVFGGINFLYFCYDNGELIDEFYDDPKQGYTFDFKRFNSEVATRFYGHPHKILPYCKLQITEKQIFDILNYSRKRDSSYLGEDGLLHLTSLLGIDESRSLIGYKDFKTELSYPAEDRDIDSENFTLVEP
jgi:hypothetical protein